MPSNHFILCRPLLLLPSIFPSIRAFSNESVLHIRWSKYWSFSFNISPSSEHSGLIFFRMDWLDLLAVQGTLKSLLQHHSSKASIFWCSTFFIVQLSHPYMTTGKKPPYNPAIPFLGIYPKETRVEKDPYIPLFIAALFTMARTWKQPRCPLTDEWIKKFGTYTPWNISQP